MFNPSQLRLAADITEKKLEWEYRPTEDQDWRPSTGVVITSALFSDGHQIRIKPAPAMIPLGPEDVPPGSYVRHKVSSDHCWAVVTAVHGDTIRVMSLALSYDLLKESYLIKRPGQDWQPCHKPAD